MTSYHPSDIELAEYAAGNTDWAVSICISAHLHFCPHCREKVRQFSNLGAYCLEHEAPKAELSSNALASTLAKIKSAESGAPQEPQMGNSNGSLPRAITTAANQWPKVVRKLAKQTEKLQWSHVSPSLKAARLFTGQEKYEVNLHRIRKGGTVAEHGHNGLEITLVLEGSFSDENGAYLPGDYIVKQPGEVHRPTATQDNDCICLSVSQAPVKLTGLLGKIINPFLKIHPA